MNDDVDELAGSLGLEPVVAEAKKRFKMAVEWEGTFRPRFIDDIKFRHGDSENGYQWPNAIRRNRDVDGRPCLTLNIVRQHNLQISNEARKNKASPKIVGTGDGSTAESAQVFADVMRRVERISAAQDVYTVARNFQIDGGIGYWRLLTDYVSDRSMDQDIFIAPINDPLSVYMDPDIQQKDGSDAKWCFVFDDMPRETFKERYPEHMDLASHQPLGASASDSDWFSKNHVRVAEYFRKVFHEDKVVSFVHQGERKTILASQLPREVLAVVLDHPLTKTRPTKVEVVEWKLIAGEKVIDETIWLGKYIPVVRCVGEETVIDGQMDRKGHTRAQKDAQRMYNYNASSQVEFVGLQGKTPWIASAASIEEYESMWNTANTVNHSVLIYNAVDDEGNTLPPPQRPPAPTASNAYQSGMDTAFSQIMMVSGQWQNQMGMMGNERTGKAIGLRQEQSDTAVYHFQDNYEIALRFTATQMIDLIPKIYDTKRVVMILGEDGDTMEVEIDPKAQQALAYVQAENAKVVKKIFNPQIGKYDVAPTVGPAYGTKREQTTDALALILTQNPGLTPVVGDLLLGSMDFDKAQEAARRLRRMVPPEALGEGASPREQALEANVQALTRSLAESLQRQGKTELKLVGKEQARTTDVYEAETKRLQALKDYLPLDPDGLQAMLRKLVDEALRTTLGPILEANRDNLDIDYRSEVEAKGPAAASPAMPPGAKKAPDGQYYMPDPQREGKWLRVMPRGETQEPGGEA